VRLHSKSDGRKQHVVRLVLQPRCRRQTGPGATRAATEPRLSAGRRRYLAASHAAREGNDVEWGLKRAAAVTPPPDATELAKKTQNLVSDRGARQEGAQRTADQQRYQNAPSRQRAGYRAPASSRAPARRRR
jgi:hypothetical protein